MPITRRSFSIAQGWTIGAVALAAGLFIGAPAKAQTITVTNVSVPTYDSNISVTYGSTTVSNIIAGQIVLTATDSAMPSAPAFSIYAWCVDLYHEIGIGNNTYTFNIGGAVTTNGNGVAVSSAVANQLATLVAYGNSLMAGVDAGNATVSTALQLAIWQTEYSATNGGPGFSFSDSGSDATTLAADVTAFENYASTHTLSASTLVPLNGQQQLVTNTVSPAPEPASMALLATGALGLAAFRRRGQMRPLRAIR